MDDRPRERPLRLDITRARTLIAWEPKRSLRATLPLMTAALELDPEAWYREQGLTPPRSSWKRLGRLELPLTPQQPHGVQRTGAPWRLVASVALSI